MQLRQHSKPCVLPQCATGARRTRSNLRCAVRNKDATVCPQTYTGGRSLRLVAERNYQTEFAFEGPRASRGGADRDDAFPHGDAAGDDERIARIHFRRKSIVTRYRYTSFGSRAAPVLHVSYAIMFGRHLDVPQPLAPAARIRALRPSVRPFRPNLQSATTHSVRLSRLLFGELEPRAFVAGDLHSHAIEEPHPGGIPDASL